MKLASAALACLGAAVLVNFFLQRAARGPAARAPAPPPLRARAAPPTLSGAGLLLQKLECGAGSCRLRVAVDIKKVAGFGDLDAIRADLALSDRQKLLLTLESAVAGGRDWAPVVHDLTPEELTAGAPISLVLPLPEESIDAGLFLCKDSTGSGRCADKPFLEVTKIFSDDIRQAKVATYRAPDKIYFFQYVLLQPEGTASFFPGTPDAIKHDAGKLFEYLQTQYAPEEWTEELLRLQKMIHLTLTVRSFPVRLEQQVAHVTLPSSAVNLIAVMAPNLIAKLPPGLKGPALPAAIRKELGQPVEGP